MKIYKWLLCVSITAMSEWHYCELLERIKGEGIRVLEHNPAEGMYREMTYSSERDFEQIKGEVYE